jgi:LytR cell envelope-related transcriptional attenuator
VSTRTRPPLRERPEGARRPRDPARTRPRSSPARTFGLPVLGGALLLGLLVGFLARGGGETKTVTSVKTVTAKAAAPAPDAASGAASRPTIALAVLNGSGESGLAASTAETAKGLGYTTVSEGNAPSQVGESHVYFRAGAAAQARQVAQDLSLPAPTRLPAGGELEGAAPADARVVAVLGPTAAGVLESNGTTDAGGVTSDSSPTATAPDGTNP